MKIVWLTTRHLPDKGGMAVSSSRLLDGLRDRGHDVHLLHLARPDPAQRSLTPDAHALALPQRIFHAQRGALSASLLLGFGGDLPGYLATLWGTWLKGKSAVLFRGNDFETAIHDPRRAATVHFILTQASLVGAVSREMTERIATMRDAPVIHTPNGIDPQIWTPLPKDRTLAAQFRSQRIPAGKGVVAMVGDLKEKKGLDLAAALFSEFGLQEKAVLLTVGQIPESQERRLRALLGDGWIHEPFCSRESLPPLYLAADILFFPSHYDGTPNALLEAMSLGCLVVGSRAGGIPDLIDHGNNGYLFPTGEVIQAAKTLEMALALPEERKQALQQAARAHMGRHYTPQGELDILESALLALTE